MSGFNFGSGTLGATSTGGGFTFGAVTSAPAASTGGFAFGTALGTAAVTPASTTSTTPSLGLGGSLFGQKPAGAAAPTTGLTLGAPATTTTTTGFSLAFNKPTASATPFSLTTTTTSSTTGAGLTFGSVLTSMAPQQPAATGFSLGLGGAITSTVVSTVPSLGAGLFSSTGSTGLGQTTLGGGGGLTLGSLLATSTAVTAAPAPSIGLGGVDFSTSSENKSDTSSGANAQDSKALKDENLPPVICQDVENFQKFVKEQKQVQEDISRMSSKAISKVQDDIKSLKQLLSVSASGLQRQALAIDKLKLETAQELKNADIALRTQKTPPGLQHENTAPSDYFRSLVEQFEVQLQQYRQQIEELENHLTTQSSGSHITPQDFQTLSKKISKRKLDGAEVTLEQIEQTDSVLVENLHPGTTPDLLSLYFESMRGGNQTVKEVIMLSEGAAKVSFANYDSVDHILNLQHKLDDAELVVKPYYDFLQPAPSEDVEFESQDITEKSSEDSNALQKQTGPILVDADQSSPAGPSDSGLSSSSQTALEPAAAGETVEMVEEEVMEDGAEKAQTLTCDIPITDPVKYCLFQCSTVYQDLQKNNPTVSIQIKDDCVHIAGPDRLQVEQIKHTVLDFIGNMVMTHFTLDLEKAQFLVRKDVEEQLLKTMNQPDSPATYTISDTNVMVTAVSQSAVHQACSFLKSQVSSLSIPVDTELECMLYCREWAQFLQTLGFTSVKVSERGGNIDVLTLKGMEDQKRAAILEFLSTPIESESVISMDPGMLKYVQIHCHQLLADMDQVSIVPLDAEDVSGLKIHGHAVACQMAEEVLQGVVSSICTRTITVNAPGVARFLDEKECRSILNEMETKFQVYINLEYVPWKPLPHQDVFEAAWKMMSHKNFQKVSPNDSPPELKLDPLPMDLNGVSNKGLLEEAKRIVSAIDKSQEEEVVAADQLTDVDHMDLYTADEPGSLTVLDSDTTAAEAPQPLADQSAASGPLLMTKGALGFASNLEEEAQLSLAIQFSMESSQWTLEDEEKQLQKALELSKKMTQNESSPSAASKRPQVDLQKENVDASLQDAIKAANTIQLHVFAGYSCDLIRVDIAFNKKVTQRQVEEKLEHRSVRSMSDYHRKCLEVIKRKHAVQIELEGTIIAVSGFKDYVPAAMCDVKLLMEKICHAVTDKEILKTVQWERHLTSSDTTPYSPDATVFIENSWRMKLKKVDILLDNQPHVIDFEKMTEYNVASEKSVKISRKLLELIGLSEDLPEEEYSLLSNMPEATKVDEESDEFQSVVRTFYETIHEHHSKIRIIQVEKLMNRLLYNQYKLKKASILQRSSHPEVERTLYHGTSEESVKEICVHGFNRSFCGKNATVYGQGVYFAVNSSLSVKSQYSPPNADGYKFILVSKVLTGDFTKGDHSMRTAPLKETGDVPLRYDSVTDDITKPTMFVIFNDTQAFPEYLITCQQIHR